MCVLLVAFVDFQKELDALGATAHGFKNGARVLGEELGPSLVLVKRVTKRLVHGSKRLASAHCVDAGVVARD